MPKFTVPNWAQALIAKAASIEASSLAVRLDNDSFVCFMDLKTRKEYIVSKSDGAVTEH